MHRHYLSLISFCILAMGLNAQFADAVDLSDPRGDNRDLEIADFDGDSDLDVLAIQNDFFNPGSMLWYPNDGSGNFDAAKEISSSIGAPTDVEVVDFNKDGSPDILASFAGENTIAWYVNDGTGSFSLAQILADSINDCRNVHAADLDNDGDDDVLSVYDETGIFDTESYLLRFENLGSGVFGPAVRVTTEDLEDPTDINAADLDGDGLRDIVCASLNADDMTWYRNLGGGNFGLKTNIPGDLVGARQVEIADPDGDGDMDLLTASVGDDRVAWFENSGTGTFTLHRLSSINSSVDDCLDVDWIDYDNDGDLDVAAALLDENAIHLFENLGSGAFATFVELTTNTFGGSSVDGADLDGDGLVDMVSGSQVDAKVAWYRGTGGGNFSDDLPVSMTAGGANATAVADLNGDGNLDVISTSSLDQRLAWYPNLGGNTFGPQIVLSMELPLCSKVAAEDLNNDGHVDMVVGAEDMIMLYTNDGSANFTEDTLTNAVDRNPRELIITDLDGNGTPDLVSTSWWDSKVAWYSNDGSGNFGPQILIESVGGADALVAADWDGDLDVDLVVGNEFSDRYLYLENLGGASFAPSVTLVSSVNGTYDATAGDANGDGTIDLIFCGFFASSVGYVPFAGGSWGAPQNITTSLFNPYEVDVWDPDGDGDMDILVPVFGENRFVSIENNGGGSFGARRTVYDVFENPNSATPVDIDGDGDDDMVGTFGNTVTFLENTRLSLCDDQNPPLGLSATVDGSGASLSWTPISNSVACQVQGRPLGAPGFANLPPIVAPEPSSAFVPASSLTPGLTYEWKVRCACSLSPLTATPFSTLNTFSVPAPKLDQKFSFYPNPASGQLNLVGLSTELVELHDLQGRLLISQTGGNHLDLSQLDPGLYWISVQDGQGRQTWPLEVIR